MWFSYHFILIKGLLSSIYINSISITKTNYIMKRVYLFIVVMQMLIKLILNTYLSPIFVVNLHSHYR